jgi:hypothetical protein
MNWKASLGAFVTMCIVTLIGVFFWFRPIEEADEAAAVLVPPALNLLIYALLSVLLFDWAVRQMKSPYAAAFLLGAAQYIFVIDLTLRGARGIATAGASAVLIIATWLCVAFIYSLLSSNTQDWPSSAA